MTFITGMILIDAPASALNNSGENIPGARTDNTSSVKFIQASDGRTYPYVSAQAIRYWLRNTLEGNADLGWQSSPILREEKIAYTDGNPLLWWDDDLLGYMRAPKKGKKSDEVAQMTPMEEDEKGNYKTITRVSPLRMSTFVSIAPVRITTDFGTMSRHEGDPVPYEHQFYRALLNGLFSLDLGLAGKFYYRRRTGFQNLDEVRRKMAVEMGLDHLEAEKAYRLKQPQRLERLIALLKGMGQLEGGAKQTIHYTDVSPAVVILAVTRGGNHAFNYLFDEKSGNAVFNGEVFQATLVDGVKHNQFISPVFVGWKPGFAPEQAKLVSNSQVDGLTVEYSTPRTAFENVAQWLDKNPNQWDR